MPCKELSNVRRSLYISQAARSCFGHIARGDKMNMDGHALKLRRRTEQVQPATARGATAKALLLSKLCK